MFNKNNILIIAEIAQSHEGSLGLAHSYIDAIADAGANAVKFQTHFAEEESSILEPWRIKFSTQDLTRFDYWKRIEFTPEQWIELAKHAHERKLLFISSPFSIYAVDVLLQAGIDVWKIASGEISNYLLINYIAKSGKPIIISTGMSYIEEIDKTVDIIKKNNIELLIMQCTSNYPVLANKVGINNLSVYQTRYNTPVGLSDHSGNIYSSLAAVSLGANAIEVHVTFSKKMFGPDVKASVTIEELKDLVFGINWIKQIIDNPVDKNEVLDEFTAMRNTFMQSLVSKTFIPEGKIIEISDIINKKPNIGIPVSNYESIIGRKTKMNIPQGTYLQYDMFE